MNLDSLIYFTNFQVHSQQREEYGRLVTMLTKSFIHHGFKGAAALLETKNNKPLNEGIKNPVPEEAVEDKDWDMFNWAFWVGDDFLQLIWENIYKKKIKIKNKKKQNDWNGEL